MVAADDQVRAAVVLAEHRVQQRLARARVAHVERVARLHDGLLHEVVLGERGDGLRAHGRRDVAGLQRAEQRVHEQPVADLDRRLGEVLVRPVHRVARLERGDRRPAQRLEQRPRLAGRHEERRVRLGEAARRQHLDRPGEVHLRLRHHHGDAGVRRIRRAEHRRAFVRLVDRVLLRDEHRRQRLPVVGIDQRDLVARADRVDERQVRRQRDRDRPEEAARRLHAVAHALPVGVRHEALERREAADAEHDDVALLARADGELRQRGGLGLLGGERVARQQQRPQVAASMGINQ